MRRLLMGTACALAAVAGVWFYSTHTDAAPQPLVIIVQPTQTPQTLTAQARELEALLGQALGRRVVLRFPTSYAGAIEALRFGHAQAAFMGAWPAALAHQYAGAEVVLAEVREVSVGNARVEAPHYYSYWVVRPDSPYQALEDLRGKSAAFPSQLSSSGYAAPLARLVELGLVAPGNPADPKSFFGEVRMAGGYAQAWEALRSGQAEVSVIAGDVAQALYEEVLSQTRIIETQGPIPSHAVLVASSMEPELRRDLIRALLLLNEPRHRGLMRRFVSGIFVRFEPATTEGHLSALNAMLRATGLDYEEKTP